MLEKDLKKAEKDFTKVKKKLENEVNELQVWKLVDNIAFLFLFILLRVELEVES